MLMQISIVFAIVIFAILLFPINSEGSWICREASSTRMGEIILSCGIGRSSAKQKAKIGARESALEEFNRICSLSNSCRPYEVNITPKRTECLKKSETFTCYRAIEFQITNKKKKDLIVDVELVKNEQIKKQNELNKLEEYLQNLKNLKRAEDQIKQTQNKINELYGESIKLNRWVSDDSLRTNEYK